MSVLGLVPAIPIAPMLLVQLPAAATAPATITMLSQQTFALIQALALPSALTQLALLPAMLMQIAVTVIQLPQTSAITWEPVMQIVRIPPVLLPAPAMAIALTKTPKQQTSV